MNHILVVKLSAIGDTVHAVPSVAALRARHPGATITWVVERSAAPLVRCLDCVDRTLVLDTRAWRKGRKLTGPEGPWRVLSQLRDRPYDVALDFQGLLKSALVARLSGARRRIGWAPPVVRERMASRLYTETVDEIPTGIHVIDICASLLTPLGVETAPRVFPYRFPDHVLLRVEDFLRPLGGGPFLTLNPGGGWPTKRWPPSHYGRLAALLARDPGLPIVVVYGPGEEPLLEAIRREAPNVVPFPATLRELAVLARRTACFVGGDTGPMHISSAMGAPVVALFGPTDPVRNGPFLPGDIVLYRTDRCHGSWRRRCDHHICMDFSPEEVADAVRRRLAPPAASPTPHKEWSSS